MYYRYAEYKQRQAGERYEHYVAQTLRADGWAVIETGLNGMQDHGIDLIASKAGTRRYIQCKGWNQDKLIHEDVVSHLLGSVAAIEGLDNLQGVELFIYSPAQLDSYATNEAARLNIQFVRLPFEGRSQRGYRPYRAHRRHQRAFRSAGVY